VIYNIDFKAYSQDLDNILFFTIQIYKIKDLYILL
jgi:hypothetical protein